MALRYILSFSSPVFVPIQPETNQHFVGKYQTPQFRYLPDLRQALPFEPVNLSPNIYVLGKYQTPQFRYLLDQRQFKAEFIASGLGPDLPYTTSTGIAAAGTTQGTATLLTAQDNEVTSSDASNTGLKITLTTPGIPTIVHYYTGNGITGLVYPPNGAQINRLGVNIPYQVFDQTSMGFNCSSPTQYYSTVP